jgi:hypothetical protein
MLKRIFRFTFVFLLISVMGFVGFAGAAENILPKEVVSQVTSLQEIDTNSPDAQSHGFFATIACGTCQELTVTDIPLCPPASEIINVFKFPVIDDITICFDKVLVNAHVFKVIVYRDLNGAVRTRVFCVPVDCCIDIPGANPFHDRVSSQEIVVECEKDELRRGGRILHEKMCVRITVGLERFITGDPCPLVP